MSSDLRQAIRILLRRRMMTVIVLLTLALGIGTSSAVLSVVDSALLKPLRYPDSDRLVQFVRILKGVPQEPDHVATTCGELPRLLRSYSAAACYAFLATTGVLQDKESKHVRVMKSSHGLFEVLGVRPELGRGFSPDEDVPFGASVAVISHRVWRDELGADPNPLGRTLILDGQVSTVIGVMPAGFDTVPSADLWVPLRLSENDRGANYRLVARLKPGVSLAQAGAELDTVAPSWLSGALAKERQADDLQAEPYLDDLKESVRRPLNLMVLASLLLLGIACLNTGTILLSHGRARDREFALRVALGGSNHHVVRLLMMEAALLTGLAAIGGILLNINLVPLLISMMPVPSNSWLVPSSERALAVGLLTAFLTCVATGLAPAFVLSRTDIATVLQETNERAGVSRRVRQIRRAFVVVQVAITAALLVVAIVLARSFFEIMATDPGFKPAQVEVVRVTAAQQRAATSGLADLYQRLTRELATLPNVAAATAATNPPMEQGMNVPVFIGSEPTPRVADWKYATPEYLSVLGTSLQRGRWIESSDTVSSNQVAIVNRRFVSQYLSGQDPLGARIHILRGAGEKLEDVPRTIVGVVADARQQSLDAPAPPMVYVPLSQVPDPQLLAAREWYEPAFLLRVQGASRELFTASQQIVRTLAPDYHVTRVTSLEAMVTASTSRQAFYATLLALFAVVATVIAASGVYGIIVFAVAQRHHEFGVRMAFGATSNALAWSVVVEGFALTAIGSVIGLSAIALTLRTLSGLIALPAVPDATTVAVAIGVLVIVGAAAAALPAIRLARMSPVAALTRRA